MRTPKLLSHIFDSDSKSVSFGWVLLALATYGAFYLQFLDPDTWLWCVMLAVSLVASKSAKELLGDQLAAKLKAPKQEKESNEPSKSA